MTRRPMRPVHSAVVNLSDDNDKGPSSTGSHAMQPSYVSAMRSDAAAHDAPAASRKRAVPRATVAPSPIDTFSSPSPAARSRRGRLLYNGGFSDLDDDYDDGGGDGNENAARKHLVRGTAAATLGAGKPRAISSSRGTGTTAEDRAAAKAVKLAQKLTAKEAALVAREMEKADKGGFAREEILVVLSKDLAATELGVQITAALDTAKYAVGVARSNTGAGAARVVSDDGKPVVSVQDVERAIHWYRRRFDPITHAMHTNSTPEPFIAQVFVDGAYIELLQRE